MTSKVIALTLVAFFGCVSAYAAGTTPFVNVLSPDSHLALALDEVLPFDMTNLSQDLSVKKGFFKDSAGSAGYVVTCSTYIPSPKTSRANTASQFTGCVVEKVSKKPANLELISLETLFTESL